MPKTEIHSDKSNICIQIDKNVNSLKVDLAKGIDELNINISVIQDKNLLKRVAEEICLLNDFIRFSTSDVPKGNLEIDDDMKKKPKTQRSWFTRK
eukprot:GAHX01002287.1.p1 GENE.GAHX01002287.1~~GAHX01002287.1.p1  ORF type:complete len:95 (-),score=8.92 GAHX01002287.1:39-323(-)